MKIAYYSDLHIDNAGMKDISIPYDKLVEDDVDVIVLAGDISNRAYDTAAFIERTLDGIKATQHGFTLPVVFVPGNHEFYKTPVELSESVFMDIANRYANFHFLTSDKSHVMISDGANGSVAFIGDILWTDFMLSDSPYISMERAGQRMNDYRVIYGDFYGGDKYTPFHTRDHHRNAVMNIVDEVNKIREMSVTTRIVMVTHHAPTYESIHETYKNSQWSDLNPAYASGILDPDSKSYNKLLAEEVCLWIHGHVHNEVNVNVGPQVVANPRGYTISSYDRYSEQNENPDFSWNKYVII